ncbi:MAG TPA: DUF2785 domain-containing protein [Vitreimonas sp.]|uniref:DUF2785 domain-containing protein n=1 Tax=Vitreimonas sp. TaxID=3069702 RepID=UPI002D5671F4|nr:DUF2785 domain-containing protein [Vitreimonas sp.]HYD87840.1 DUF2785 domain-containing protein [Vitreimonas sp.]
MRQIVFAALFALAAVAATPAQAQQTQCRTPGYDRAALDALKAADWALANDRARNRLALALADCLGNPDPTLRDGIAFEALAHWLRARQLSRETMLALADALEPRLSASDEAGFERPFAALVLSEVARADRIEAYMTPERRTRLLDSALAYFAGVTDYRGFDEREGWRHGVAHGADLLLQLALNPAFGQPELDRIREALALQIAPSGHFYSYGESERIVRPLIFIAQRGVFSADDWRDWLVRNTHVDADGAFSSQAGLARRHNMMAFLSVLYMQANLSQNEADNALLPGAEAALRALP